MKTSRQSHCSNCEVTAVGHEKHINLADRYHRIPAREVFTV